MKVDWFPYFLHPERLQSDFSTTQNSAGVLWTAGSKEQRDAGVQVLHGILGSSNFKEHIISSYPTLREPPSQQHRQHHQHHKQHTTDQSGYSGPTPPSTPTPEAMARGTGDLGGLRRVGQCSQFSLDSSGMPNQSLSEALRAGGLPELTAKQERLLNMAATLTELLDFSVEEIERAVHATLRFIYFLYMLEYNRDKTENVKEAVRLSFSRWVVRAAYREEEIGLSLDAECSAGMDANSDIMCRYAEGLDGDSELQFRLFYDLARLSLAQSRFGLALKYFKTCQSIDPDRCRPSRLTLSSSVGQTRPCIDEYVVACSKITAGVDAMQADTPTGMFDSMRISRATKLEGSVDPVKESVAGAMACEDPGFGWLLAVHPLLLSQHKQAIESTVSAADAISDWIAANSVGDEAALEERAAFVSAFVGGGRDKAQTRLRPETISGPDTLAEAVLRAHDALPMTGAAKTQTTALVRSAHAYLAGLRQLERERYAEARAWFEDGQAMLSDSAIAAGSGSGGSAAVSGPVMAQAAEKDRALRASLQTQLSAHAQLADVLDALAQGALVDDLAPNIDAVIATQAPMRFEFLEIAVMACLRQGSRDVFTRLVAALGTNQKLYQQLPELHLALLQIASLLAVMRDALYELQINIYDILAGIDKLPKSVDDSCIERLRLAVGEIAALVLKIPAAHATGEGAIERMCRLLDDAPLIALVGMALEETAAVIGNDEYPSGPWALSQLAHRIAHHEDAQMGAPGTDQRRRNARLVHSAALAMLQHVSRTDTRPPPSVLLSQASAAHGLRHDTQAAALLVECVCSLTTLYASAVDACANAPWFRQRVQPLAQALRGMGMSGAAAVLLQLQGPDAAVPMVVQAFERGEIDQRVAGFFWDPSVIEYAEYLARLPGARVNVRFAVPGDGLAQARPLLLAAFFAWLAATLNVHAA
ncbi:hypothetical protein LPJ64_004988 [Coemansia asiatica]|uniref:Uncharacterized protein n=1 Tax=Coemansia asiatica TaxID=1052880 RepID=A0A9W7XI05_9FUNG|nr:hypothetical protein LPJ64_004988 [Coemansia asiatica]